MKVLESLVARGRRVRNFRETREVTFGLADLSTHAELHERIVKKGGVETLVNILITAQDAEAQQFAALAIANTAATKSLCSEIVTLDGVVAGLVQYVGNEEADSIGRQYSALAIGNLLAEPATHETIVEAKCVDALITMLRNCCSVHEFDASKYAAFSLANIASNCQYHSQIVEGGGIELLVALACCEDIETQRQSLASVRGLCTTVENRKLLLQKGILDPLILMSRSNNNEMVQEVAAVLNCLSSQEENKEEISYRAISTLISLLVSGDDVVERNSCCAIANLLEVMDTHSRFLEERGVAPLISLCSSSDARCSIEATRAIANLSSKPEMIELLVEEKALGPLVKCVEQDGNNCRFAALAIANFATHVPSLFHIVQAGAVPHLVTLISSSDYNLEGKRYGALALANMTVCEAFHSIILDNEGPEALFALSNSYDDLESRRFAAMAMANLSANASTHERLVEMGGLQCIIALAYDSDQTIHGRAAAALRAFSATGDNNTKIVHEGGLEPLCRLLLSEDLDILHETTACMCNLSLADESKFELTKSGVVPPLISLIQNEDSTIANYACECLANLSEMSDNQDVIAREGVVVPCMSAMRSRRIEIQRESGRLLANLAGNVFGADTIIDSGGHELLTSFLLSQDTDCQRVGAFGIGNLCTHEHHRRGLMVIGVLEPLSTFARSGKVELEIRRYSMLAIANLAACFDNHDDFVSQNIVSMLVSFSNSADAEIRNYAAFAVAELSRNPEMMEIITGEGGLESVLYLARSDDKKVQRQVLGALTTLSFLDCNKVIICTNGALPTIVDCLSEGKNNVDESQLACCAIANLLEVASNIPLVVTNHGALPLLIDALDSDYEAVKHEAARAIGNLCVNANFCDLAIQQGAATRLVTSCFQSRNCECKRMVSLALSNLSSNVKSHSELFELDVLSLVRTECLVSLDPKRFSDYETARYCLLIISNLLGNKQNHNSSSLDSYFDVLMDFTRHHDVKCRQHAILAIGNLCTNPIHIQRLLEIKCTDALVVFSFPPTSEDSLNAQFQAIAGLHGISKHKHLRVPLLREGGLEPLIIGAQGNHRFSCVDIQKEAAATLSNLALDEKNRILIAKSGALPALVNLLRNPDSTCQVHAGEALANLAESCAVHELLLTAQCLKPMCMLIQVTNSTRLDVKRAVSRCISLLASNPETHTHILQSALINSMKKLIADGDTRCQRWCTLTVANLALRKENHRFLLENKSVESLLLPLINSNDVETHRGVSFALHSFSRHEENHSVLEDTLLHIIEALVLLARSSDRDTALQACLATKYLCGCKPNCRNMFVQSHGLEPLLMQASKSDDLETKTEVCAALQNISLSDQNKEEMMNKSGMIDILCKLARDQNNELAHQAIAVIANVAECQSNKVVLVEQGIIHHLHYSMMSKSIPVLRESIRAFAALSSDRENAVNIMSSGALSHLINALVSTDARSRRFAAMAISNLASSDENKIRIVRENGVLLLMSNVRQTESTHAIIDDKESRHHAMACLANLASCHELHDDLLNNGCAELSMNSIKQSSDLDLRTNALLCLSNFASNRKSHRRLGSSLRIHEIIENLDHHSDLQLRAVTTLRGLSVDPSYREEIIKCGGVESLLSFVNGNDDKLKIEVLTTLCNLSLGGFLGNKATTLLQNIDIQGVISYLCNSDSSHRLFGAVAIGNILSNLEFQQTALDSGALQPLIGLSNDDDSNMSPTDVESQRCMAYALCNLLVDHPNRMSIILKGGLPSVLFLCRMGDNNDMQIGLSTLQGLAVSAEARRSIVEEGVLHVLSLGMKTGCLECKREVSSILALICLNEENKVDILHSDEMKELIALTDIDDTHCVIQMCRSFGSIAEINELHSELIDLISVERLERLSCSASPSVALEVSRLYTNLAFNFDTHALIVKPQVVKNFCGICCSNANDAGVRRFATLALANMCLNPNSCSALDREELVSILLNVIKGDGDGDGDKDDENMQSKCHALIAISALCEDSSLVPFIVQDGIIPELLSLLKLEKGSHYEELYLHVAFLLNKLSMATVAAKDLYQVASSLVGQTQEANENAVTYSIAALRRMCEDKTIRSTNTVEFLRKHCNLDIVERCREVASCLYNLALWVDAREHIIKSGIFGCISSLAKSYDEETARFALGALANIANDTRYHDVVAGKDGVVSTILALTQSFTLSIARESCRALANVLSSLVAQMIVLQQEEGMKSLIHVSTLQDYECALSAAVAFRKLSANSHSHEAFFSQDGAAVNAIINLTCRQETSIQLQSADALQHIASNPYFQLVFVEMGGVRAAIELSSSLHVKTIAFGIVRQLSIPMSLKRSLVASGIVGIMSDCVNSDAQGDDIDSTEDLLYQCAASIANMAEHAQNKLVLVQMGVINCLVSLCKSKSAKVKRETARAFSLLTSAPGNNIPTKVIPNILDLLHSQDEGTARDGAATISNIVVDTENSSLVGGALCGIPPLVLLLSSPYESCQMNSCKCLCRLTAGITFHENKTSVFSNGGLTPLIQLCSSSNQGVALMAVMVMVNLSSLEGYQIKFVEQNSIPPLQQLLFSDCPLTRKNTTMVLCNLASHHSAQDYVMKQVGLFPLYELIKNDQDSECQVFAIMTICNLGRQTNCESILEAPGGLLQLLMAMVNGKSPNLRRASLMTLYNLSSCESSHALYVKYGAVQEIVASIVNSDDVLCRRFALMILANLSCSDKTRVAVKKGGGLQAAVSSLKDDDLTTQRFACVCLANMSNDTAASSQVVVHGGLQPLLRLCQMYDDADKTQECASMCISNLVVNEVNQSEQGSYKAFVDNNSESSSSIFITFAIANMTNNRNEIGQDGAAVLVELAGIGNLHSRCLALSSLRRLSFLKGHRDRMMEENFIETLVSACRTTETEIQREVASCLCNLSLSSCHHIRIAQSAIPELMTLAKKSDDVDVMRLSLVALGNLSENVDTHPFFVRSVSVLDTVLDCLICEELDIKREAARVTCNLLNSPDTHPRIIQSGLDSLLLLSTDNCEECRYFAAFSLQKLSQKSIHSHHILINNLKPILSMIRGEQKKTQKHSVIALRNLCASKEDRYELFAQGVPNSMVDLMKENDKDLCLLAIATLRHLSTSDRIKEGFSSSGIMQSVIRCCTRANEVDIKCQTAGLFANLSEHRECQPTIIASGIVQAINSLITIENDEIWQDCSRTLANLCSHEGKQANIHRQGVLQTLAKLGKSTSDVCERYVAIALRFMSSCVEVQQSHDKSYFPYLEFSASNLLDFQRAAAAAFASMSLNDTGKSLVLKKGGVKSILQLCIHLDLAVRRDAVHSVANFVASPNFCQYVVIEGGVETIKAVALSNNNVEVLRDASRALSSLSTDDATKGIMVSHEMTKVLCKLAKSPDSATQQFASLALSNLCSGTREEKELVVKQGVLRLLLFLLRFPDLEVERCASLAIAGLSLGSDRNKAELIDNGFIYPLVDTIAYPDARIRQCALLALNGISLGEEQETKGSILKDEKCLSSLMNLIKSDSDDESIHLGLYMLGTLAFNGDIRDTIIALDGCLQRIVDKTSTGSIEIKRAAAYFLSILSESLNYHDNLQQVGGLEAAVRLSSLVDEECQDYGTLMLAILANNKAFQVPLVNMGAIRPLVSCCSTSTSSSSSHFAGVALVRLAENYMNHIAIAEEGGLSVLLRLGRMGGKKNLQYQASLSITKMAKQAASLVEKN